MTRPLRPDRYAVVGNPVAHSRSPDIHAMFARQTGEPIEYGRLLVAPGELAAAVERFRADGGAGLNVTVPFKQDALALADVRSARAERAGAANTLHFAGGRIHADNTDGVGLLRDIEHRLGVALREARVLLVGAGGAARGVVQPLLDAGVARLLVANRTAARAIELAREFDDGRLQGGGLDAAFVGPAGERFDVIVNATSAGLHDDAPPLPASLLGHARFAYDMVYGARPTAFVRAARQAGCAQASDGLGMLVEQAAESFWLWRGVRPDTAPVLAALRAALDAEAAR